MYRNNKPLHLSPYDHPDIYPGPRPFSSFMFYNGVAHRIEENGPSFEESIIHISKEDHLYGSFLTTSTNKVTVQEFLDSINEVPIHERIPVLAYGSNVCLAQLLYKSSLNPLISDLYLCFRAMTVDMDVIYGSFLAPYGALPAILAPVQGAKTEVWLTLLDRKQLTHMSTTEGGYELKYYEGDKVELFLKERMQLVYAYMHSQALKYNESFFRFSDIPGTSPLPSSWQADMLNNIMKSFSYDGTREEFIHLLRWNQVFREEIEMFLTNFQVTIEDLEWNTVKRLKTVQEIRRK